MTTTTTARPPRQRKATRRAPSAAQIEARDAKLADLHDRLTTQVQAMATGEDWTRWLQTAARFTTYSFNNQLLIAIQRPDATYVAGYRAWQALGRQVTKGEQGIAILAPVVRKVRDDEATNDLPAGTKRVCGFRATYVWDVSQTTGEPLPEQPAPTLLQGEAPEGLWDHLATLVAGQGFTLRRGDTAPANGYTDFKARDVVVRADVDDAQAVKTLAHELAHILLHDPTASGNEHGAPGRAHGRPEQEVEAESVAYLVAATHGLDTSGYTFAYVTGWAATVTDPEQVVRDTARRVLSAAATILGAGEEGGEEAQAA